jgi:hypothetical protein
MEDTEKAMLAFRANAWVIVVLHIYCFSSVFSLGSLCLCVGL